MSVETLQRVIDLQKQLNRIEDKMNNGEYTLNEYQRLAMTTCMDSCDNISYMLTNLVGEVGEFASKIAKHIRKEEITINGNKIECYPDTLTPKAESELRAEAGDVLWQLAGLCHVMGWSLDDVARENLAKLADRKKRGVVDGNGDNR